MDAAFVLYPCMYGFGYNHANFCLCFSSSFSRMMPSIFPLLLPLPLCFCLQPSRHPSLQPSLVCLSAPSPHHHCHPNQHFASQLSLCLGNPHPPPACTFYRLPTSSLDSLSLQFPHHSFSSPTSQPQSHLFEKTTYYKHLFSQNNTKLKLETKAYPSLSLQSHGSFPSPPHASLDSLPSGSCLHKTNPLPNGHLLGSSQPKSNNSHSHSGRFSTLFSQSSPNLSSLPGSMSNVCPHTLQNVQPKSNANPKILPLPSFNPDCKTDPSAPLQPDSDPQCQHPAVLSCKRPPLASSSPITPPFSERFLPVPSSCTLSHTTYNPHSPVQSLPLTTHPPFPIPGSERPLSKPLKAGCFLFNVFLLTVKTCVSLKKECCNIQDYHLLSAD